MRGIEYLIMEPFYFRKSFKPLLGIYHPPRINTSHNVGVVLCYPMGQEYMRSHRSFFQLAQLLSSAGFDVLRFDYYGCGDSDGACNQGSIKQWIVDISTAVDELNGGCDLEKVCLVGLRLGGTLAMIAASRRTDIDSVVLWDPVVDGTINLEELKRLHDEWLQRSFARPQLYPVVQNAHEILGFPITDTMTDELMEINLLKLEQKPANKIFIIETDKATKNNRFREHLENFDLKLKYEYIPIPKVWIRKNNRDNKGLVPIPILKSIVTWISKVY
jgi:pimeloyl-ACP methyl ester carboxylesterase